MLRLENQHIITPLQSKQREEREGEKRCELSADQDQKMKSGSFTLLFIEFLLETKFYDIAQAVIKHLIFSGLCHSWDCNCAQAQILYQMSVNIKNKGVIMEGVKVNG